MATQFNLDTKSSANRNMNNRDQRRERSQQEERQARILFSNRKRSSGGNNFDYEEVTASDWDDGYGTSADE